MFVKDPFHSIQAAREQRFEPQLFPLKSAHSESAGNLRNEVEGQFLKERETDRERKKKRGRKKVERKKERKKEERKKERKKKERKERKKKKERKKERKKEQERRRKNAVSLIQGLLGRRQAERSYITLKGVYFTVITNRLYIILVITWLRDHKMKQDRQLLTVTYTV